KASLPGYVRLNEAEVHRVGEEATIRMVRGGVITGRVTGVRGEPLEGVFVDIRMVRDHEGRKYSSSLSMRRTDRDRFLTDDRGVYRIYEVPPGVYLVSAIDIPIAPFNTGSIAHDAPTYYPSADREAAVEVAVRGGEEVTGIDIRHRGSRGYSITG